MDLKDPYLQTGNKFWTVKEKKIVYKSKVPKIRA
jgi:hypothetical protein